MIYLQEKTQAKMASWGCQQCDLWWGSQPAEEPQTWRLFRLREPLTNPLLWESTSPAWKVAGSDPSVCPQCGQTMIERNTTTLEPPTHYYN